MLRSSPPPSSHGDCSDDSASASGRVSKLRQNWAVHEDGALAQRLQSQEIAQHLSGNRQRNELIRSDFPAAVREQRGEEETATAAMMERERRREEMSERDEAVARRMAEELARGDREHQRYEAKRDEIFARRL